MPEYIEVEELENSPEIFTMADLFSDWMKWSTKTFAEATPESSLIKLEEEIGEIRENLERGMHLPEEYVDAIMCLLDSAARLGITGQQMENHFRLKFEINKKRTWVKLPDNTYTKV